MYYTLFTYNTALLLCVILAYFGEKSKRDKLLFVGTSFAILLIISVLRFDVGHDYNNYVNSFKQIQLWDQSYSKEFTYYLLCRLFSFSPHGYVGVFGVYSFITLLFLYLTLRERKILWAGLFIFISYNFLFISFDQIRQSTSIIIFLYSIKYIESRNLKKFLILTAIGVCFHLIAILILPLYWLATFKIKNIIYYFLILFFAITYFLGTWYDIQIAIFEQIPIYGTIAIRNFEPQKINTGLGVLYMIIITSIIVFKKDIIESNVIVNLCVGGLLLFLFSSGNLSLDRLANFFTISQVIAIPLIIGSKSQQLLKYFFLISAFILFQKNIIDAPRGTSPYKTIFSKSFTEQTFRLK